MFCACIVQISILTLTWQICLCQQDVNLQSEVRFTKVGSCNVTGLKWILQNVSISYLYPKSTMNAVINITEEAKKLKKVTVHLDRCNDQGFNCEDFQTWYIDNFCTVMNRKNQMWSGMIEPIRPPFRCPIKKMIYLARNITYDFEPVKIWYPDYAKYHWKTETKFFNERGKLVGCLIAESHVYQYRKRNRKS